MFHQEGEQKGPSEVDFAKSLTQVADTIMKFASFYRL